MGSIVMTHLDFMLPPQPSETRAPEDLHLGGEEDGDVEVLEVGDLALPAGAPAPAQELPVHRITGDTPPAPAAGRAARGHTLAVEVPEGAASLVVMALDVDGQVLASSELALDTAVSTDVFLDLLAAGMAEEGIESVDLRVRITPELAAALASAARAAQEGHRAAGPRPCASTPIGSRRR